MNGLRLGALALLVAFPLTARAAEESGGSSASREAAKTAGEARFTEKETGLSIEVDQLSKLPKLTRPAKVEYPKDAIGKSGEVEVKLLVDLDDTGAVTGAAVIEPKTPTGLGFEEAALTAAYDLAFEPAEVAGKPVRVQINYVFKFIPPKPPAPEPEPAKVAEEAPKPKPAPVENFTGTLVERGTRLPLAGVLVTVYRTEGETPVGFEATTDAKGVFHFYDLDPGTWKVRIEPSAYYPVRTSEEIVQGERTEAKYYVERGSYNPFDVVVEAKREKKEVSRTVIESSVIEKLPGAMGDPLAVIQNFAGVARAQAGSGQIMIRGSGPYDTAYYVDGTSIPTVYHFFGLRSVIPTGMIDSLQFYPGNYSPYYSWVMGGIVDLDVKKLKPKRTGGYLDLNLLDGGFYLEIPLGEKASVALSARRSWIDVIINAALPDDLPVASLELPRYYDYQLLANYRPAAAHDLRLFVFGSDDAFKIITKNAGAAGSIAVGNQFQLATRFYRALATYKYIPSERFENTFRVSQGRDVQNIQFFNFLLDTTVDITHVRDTARYEWSKRLALTGGFDGGYGRVSGLWNVPYPPQEGQTEADINWTRVLHREISGANYYILGFFAELELRPLPNLLVLPGVRCDYFSQTSEFKAAPRFTTRYDVTKKLTLKGGVGLFYQPPSIDQTDEVFGSPTVKSQLAIHYSAGVEWKPFKHIVFDATGFYKDLRNMISTTQSSLEGDVSAARYDNNGNGRAFGLELVAKHELTKRFTGWLAYTLMKSERMDSGTDYWRLFQYDQTHILTVVATYKLPRNWQIGGRFRYVTGNPTTPVTQSAFDSSLNQYEPIYSAKYSARVPAFHQLDIRLDKTWVFNKWLFTAYVDLQNVYNRSNPEQVQFNYNYQKSQYSTGFPIYPILGLRGEL
jgi:TonB family protein